MYILTSSLCSCAIDDVGALATSVGTPSDGEPSQDDQALRRAISAQAQLRVSQACELCGTNSSAFDLVGS